LTNIRKLLFTALAGCLVLPLSGPALRAQAATTPAVVAKLPLNAVLILTPEFCATEFKQGSVWTTGRDTLAVGKTACTELEPALKTAFANLTVVPTLPASGDAQLVLIPKFANAHATTAAFAFSNREMDVFLELTVKDAAGKTVWLQTVQGTSKHHMGNAFTHAHDVKLIVTDSVKDAANQSVIKMDAAPELRKLVPESASSGK
jgi:hypothetical protein